MANEAIGKVGKDCKLYYSVAYNSPTWVQIKQAMNVDLPTITKGTVDVMSRESLWKAKAGTLKEIQLQFGYLHNNSADAVYAVLLDSFIADTVLTFAVMDGAIATAGSSGWRFPGIVTAFTMTEELEGVRTFSVTVDYARKLDNTSTLIEPDWYEISGS
jgi:hypothetical protein